MNQTSKTIKKSPATTPLYQPPTPENTVQYKPSGLAPASLIAIVVSIAILFGYAVRSADRHQTAAQVEHIVKAGVKP